MTTDQTVDLRYMGYAPDLNAAACFGKDPELWFPAPGRDRTAREAEAKSVCATCPARIPCLARSLEEEEVGLRYGIRGGLNEDERAALSERGAA